MINFFGPTLKFRNSTPFKYHCALNIEDIIYEKFKDIIVNMDIFLAAPMSSMITWEVHIELPRLETLNGHFNRNVISQTLRCDKVYVYVVRCVILI